MVTSFAERQPLEEASLVLDVLDMPRPGDNRRVLLPQLFRLLVRLLVSPLRVAAARGEGDEGKEEGDDGFLHIHFVFILLVSLCNQEERVLRLD